MPLPAAGWHLVSLNSEVNLEEQADFLRADAAHNPGEPLLVYWHQPRFSSGSQNGCP